MTLFTKVCGITRVQDADLAAELGASAIGFIFWPGSPRYIAPEEARAIVRRKNAALKAIGVFVDDSIEHIKKIVDSVQLDGAQLHGSESPAYCRRLTLPVIKGVSLQDDGSAEVEGFDPSVVILLDAHDPVRHGGTGRTVNWNAARKIAASRRTILSGGLNAGNVGEAIDAVQPYGIDVSSGVESAPGLKDAIKLRNFFEAVNG